MELFSQKFKQAVKRALESQKLVLAVVHGKAKDPLIIQAKRQEDAEIFTVTLANRDNLPLQLVRKVVDTL
jgi:nucleoside-triphosphatase